MLFKNLDIGAIFKLKDSHDIYIKVNPFRRDDSQRYNNAQTVIAINLKGGAEVFKRIGGTIQDETVVLLLYGRGLDWVDKTSGELMLPAITDMMQPFLGDLLKQKNNEH